MSVVVFCQVWQRSDDLANDLQGRGHASGDVAWQGISPEKGISILNRPYLANWVRLLGVMAPRNAILHRSHE
nr:hypothetical protein BCV24_10725 [Vibrio cyclitrophicus]